jgi:GNAT superfamily N-acetyltransferase
MLERIQQYLRVVAPIGRDHERIGPFLATFNPNNANPYLNYAVPDDNAQPTDSDVLALVDAYTQRRRRPRLEYIPGCAPGVEQRLISAGFSVEGRLSVMVTDARRLQTGNGQHGVELRTPTTDDELYDMAVVQARAYNDPELPTRDVVRRRRQALAEGQLAIIAVDQPTREVVGAGICAQISDGLTEVAAIAVARNHRRRGIGGALATRLAREALSAGADTPWLMADRDAERRIYERAGYHAIGEILHISR